MVLRIKSSSIQKRQLVLWFLVHKKPSNIFLDFSQFNCSVMSDSFATPWTAACQASVSLTITRSLSKFMSIAWVMPSNHLILWCPLLRLSSVFPSIRDFFQWVGCLPQVTKIIIWPSNSTPMYIPKRIENKYSNIYLCLFIAALFTVTRKWN